MVNTQLDGVLYNDDTFDDGDRLKVKAEKREAIRLRFADNSLTYEVPLNLDILYNLGLVGKVGADAAISLIFKTEYAVQSDWTLTTRTVIEDYKWLAKPRVRLGSLSIPAGLVANFILNRSRETLAKNIDQAIQRNLDLRPYVQQAWTMLHTPFEASPEYSAWLLIRPDTIGMSPLRIVDDTLNATITVRSKPQMVFGSRPAMPRLAALPPFQYLADDDKAFQIYLNTTLSYAEAERLARQQLLGETFEQGKRKVRVDDLKLFGQGEKLVIEVRLSGSYKGSVYLSGYPRYNADRNAIDIKDLDFTLDTRNFLYRTGSWLLKGTLKRKIQENMDFLLAENLKDITRQVEQQLEGYQPVPGVTVTGNLETLELQNAYLTVEGMRVAVSLRGQVDVRVAGLMGLK